MPDMDVCPAQSAPVRDFAMPMNGDIRVISFAIAGDASN